MKEGRALTTWLKLTAKSKMRLDGDTLVLIINDDAKPIEEAHESEYLPGHNPWEALKFSNRHRRLPHEAVNLYPHAMHIGLESADRSPNVDQGLHSPT
jgi:hypothetical protein